MDAVRADAYAKISHHIIGQLKKRNMGGSYAATGKDAVDKIISMIPSGSSIYRVGSMTLRELGIVEALSAIPGTTILDPHEPGLTPDQTMMVRKQGFLADFMICSTNAVTLDGKLVNLDGMGNRVAAMAFGPTKVILVVGMNKVVSDVDEAMKRVKHRAAPINTIRLGLNNPCRETGLCADCKSPSRICNIWTIIEGHMIKDRIFVLMVGEDRGY
jgi:hypothetical protein